MKEKLSKDGLMDEIMLAMNSAVATAHQQYPSREARITQAREQIKSLIEAQAEPSIKVKELRIINSEEFRAESKKLFERSKSFKELYDAQVYLSALVYKLYVMPPMRKPKVSREFVEKWNQTIAERVNVQMKKVFIRDEIGLVYPGTENLTQMLEKVGCEVEK